MNEGEWKRLPDLASRRLGGGVPAANDEFFAARENLIRPERPEFRPHTFTLKGQEYDGWETRRRRREPGDHDWVIVRLGLPGVVRGVVVDTAFFTGNYPPFAAVDGLAAEGYPDPAELAAGEWEPVVSRSPLKGGTENAFDVSGTRRYTHVRLRIFPDGGVARLRVHGVPVPDPAWLRDMPFDLAALANGAGVDGCSDWYFSPATNMLQPGESLVMADGWESARRRDDGNDWAVVRLAAHAVPRVLEIDTRHYKGNAPDRAVVTGVDAAAGSLDDPAAWRTVLPETRLQPDTAHRFRALPGGPVTHLRLDVYPDGGVARFRAYGEPTAHGVAALTEAWERSTGRGPGGTT